MSKPLTPADLAELERMLIESGAGDAEALAKAKAESHGLDLFVRSLVGLSRSAAKAAFADLLAGTAWKANQIELVSMVIDHLVEHGVMDAALLYESPYADFSPLGVDGIFPTGQVERLIGILDEIRRSAA